MDYLPDQHGRCMTCGYLAQRINEPAFEPALREVNEKQRSNWSGEIVILGHATVATTPTCYVKAFNLEAEYNRGNSAEMVRQMFGRERKCPKWYPYTHGFSPKEHLEEYRVAQTEADRRRFEWRMLINNWIFQVIISLFLGFIALLSVPWFSKWLLGR